MAKIKPSTLKTLEDKFVDSLGQIMKPIISEDLHVTAAAGCRYDPQRCPGNYRPTVYHLNLEKSRLISDMTSHSQQPSIKVKENKQFV